MKRLWNNFKLYIIWSICITAIGLLQIKFNFFILNEVLERAPIWCALAWVLYALFSGYIEAYYYCHEMHSSYKDELNEHWVFTVMRALLFISLWIICKDAVLMLCLFVAFPFVHDGMYYTQRDILENNRYPLRWFDQSTTSTAIWTKVFTPIVRTSLFVAACAVYAYWWLNNY